MSGFWVDVRRVTMGVALKSSYMLSCDNIYFPIGKWMIWECVHILPIVLSYVIFSDGNSTLVNSS